MKRLLVIIIGMYATAQFMMNYAIDFERWIIKENDGYLFNSALHAISPSLSILTGMSTIPPMIFFLLCFSAGLSVGLIAVTVVPVLLKLLDTHLFLNFFKALSEFVLQNEKGDRCIVELSAVRWLSKDEMWALMHPPGRF